jgi:prepilin-type N-terminal cleavage/methylation domain-containing protein
MRSPHNSGFTLAEVLTALVALVVIAAVTVPLWHAHELRQRREDGIAALLAVQTAQDQYFGEHALYAKGRELAAPPPQGLGVSSKSRRGFYELTIRDSADGLGYTAIARVKASGSDKPDARCVELRIDQNGRRFAVDAEGVDRSADCWNAN